MNPTPVCFQKHIPAIGSFSLRPLQIPDDMALIHRWVNLDYARYWGLQGMALAEVEAEYRNISAKAQVYLGFCNNAPAFLLEYYDPRQYALDQHYAWQAGDAGMHILVAPAEQRIADFTWTVFTVIMAFIFDDRRVQRLVVEPDIRNADIHTLNKRAGFVYQKTINLPNKTAYLAFCTRNHYYAALAKASRQSPPQHSAAHLQADTWAQANTLLLIKAISELAHELVIVPEHQYQEGEWGYYRLPTDQAAVEYRFRAQLLSLEHWHIDPASLEKWAGGNLAALDALAFITENQASLGIAPALLPIYMEEITSTLYGSSYKLCKQSGKVAELVGADFQTLETAMMAGHPAFIANNGRIGFDAADYQAYAPEAATPVNLIWLAAHKSKVEFACSEDLTYEDLLVQELGTAALANFARILEQQGLVAADYYLLPVHPWQWYNKLVQLFAADLAAKHLLCLGYGDDAYLAQQSIRTFFNISQPHKRYVKTALSILNMGFMRGLSPYYMSTTPAINDCINGLISQDPYLSAKGFSILREVAAIGYRHSHYEAALRQDSPYKKMLAALWRDSPVPQLQAGQRLMTMAALLHTDGQGAALLPALIAASGLSIHAWLQAYLDCYLSPLLHCFYAYDLVFMPHGENLILVLENQVPIRAIMKDIAEEAAIMNPNVLLSDKVQRLAVDVPEELKLLSIFTDCFDLIFRYLAEIFYVHSGFPEHQFWQLVAACILDYQAAHPELAEKFARHDLFAPEFIRSCLNRLQLRNNQQMVDLANPAQSLQFVGTLANPIAAFRPVSPKSTNREADTEACL